MQLFASPEKDHQLESRMRENRPSGLEGGGGGQYPPLPTPIQTVPWSAQACLRFCSGALSDFQESGSKLPHSQIS